MAEGRVVMNFLFDIGNCVIGVCNVVFGLQINPTHTYKLCSARKLLFGSHKLRAWQGCKILIV